MRQIDVHRKRKGVRLNEFIAALETVKINRARPFLNLCGGGAMHAASAPFI